MAVPEAFGLRQAALLLHGLPLRTRREVLAKLDPAQLTRLDPLLAELDSLRIPRTLAPELPRLATAAVEPGGGEETFSARADRLPPHLVVQCLKFCASVTVARLLSVRDWSWRATVLERLPGARRVEVTQYLRKDWPLLAPAVLASMCERLCIETARLQMAPARAADPHGRKRFGRRWFVWTP